MLRASITRLLALRCLVKRLHLDVKRVEGKPTLFKADSFIVIKHHSSHTRIWVFAVYCVFPATNVVVDAKRRLQSRFCSVPAAAPGHAQQQQHKFTVPKSLMPDLNKNVFNSATNPDGLEGWILA